MRSSFGIVAISANIGAALLIAVIITPVISRTVAAQSSASDWEKAAGGRQAFDVASIRQNKSGEPAYRATSNFPLGLGESYAPNGGLFSASNFSVPAYIG